MKGFPSGGNSTLVYFTCADCADEAGRVKSSGGKIQREKTPTANTASSFWRRTPKATWSGCIR